jgi:hypothetical protein
VAGEYRHTDQAVQRPDAGVQDQFQARKPPKTYRYDRKNQMKMSMAGTAWIVETRSLPRA